MLTISSSASGYARNIVRWQSSSAPSFRIELPLRAASTTFSRQFSRPDRHATTTQSTRCINTTASRRREQDLNASQTQSALNVHLSSISASQSTTPEHAARLARNEYGDRLPDNVLSAEALSVYRRLYGEPLPLGPDTEKGNELQSRDKSGNWEAISSRLDEAKSFEYELVEEEIDEEEEDEDGIDEDDPDMEAEGDDLFAMDPGYIRTHPFTLANRFGTSPKTLQIPQGSVVKPIADMLASSASTKNLEVATQRVFGGVGLPYSPSTPSLSRTMPQRPVALSARQAKMPELDADSYLIGVYSHAYASITSALVEVRKRLGSQWLRGLLGKEGGPLVLDAGSGGAGALAWRDIARAEWNVMQDEQSSASSHVDTMFEGELTKEPKTMPGRMTVVVGSDTLRHRASQLLDSTTFIPRLPDAVPTQTIEGSSPRKQYDVILAPYSLWRIEKEFDRKYYVQTLWSLLKPEGGLLILLEKGVPRGFEVIAGAREHLLKRHIVDPESISTTQLDENAQTLAEFSTEPIQKEKGMIVAPCTNHSACPLYQTAGLGRGRKDYCYFSQRFIRPPFLQSALGARRRNHEDVEFSYIAVQRGVDLRTSQSDDYLLGDVATDRAFEGYGSDRITSRTQDRRERKARPHASTLDDSIFADAEAQSASSEAVQEAISPPHSLTLPRLILPPLKRKGHIVLDVCTPSGTFERWLVTRRNGKQAYRDARKAKWGDLWALGAKTREPRRIRVGTVEKADKGFKKSSRGRRNKEMRDVLAESGLIDE